MWLRCRSEEEPRPENTDLRTVTDQAQFPEFIPKEEMLLCLALARRRRWLAEGWLEVLGPRQYRYHGP